MKKISFLLIVVYLLSVSIVLANPPQNPKWELIYSIDNKNLAWLDTSSYKIIGTKNPYIKCWEKHIYFSNKHGDFYVIELINIDINTRNHQILEENYYDPVGKLMQQKIFEDAAWETPVKDSKMDVLTSNITDWFFINHKF